MPVSGRCAATREAVWEQEEKTGDPGCPLCGRGAYSHDSEDQGRDTPQVVNGQTVGP